MISKFCVCKYFNKCRDFLSTEACENMKFNVTTKWDQRRYEEKNRKKKGGYNILNEIDTDKTKTVFFLTVDHESVSLSVREYFSHSSQYSSRASKCSKFYF